MIHKLSFFGLLLVGHAYAGEPLAQRFSRDVVYQSQGQQVLLAVPLDGPVYAESASDFSDLRLIDSQGVETPYSLQKIAGSETIIKRFPVHSEKPTLEKFGEDGIIVSIDLEKDELGDVDGLTVVTGQRDFEYELQVQGSEDGKTWHSLLQNGMIYDYSRFMKFGNRDVVLPGNSDRHFKITVAKAVNTQAAELLELSRSVQGGQELRRDEKIDLRSQPLHIERIDLWRNETETVPENERRFDYPLTEFSISQDRENKRTLIDVDAQLLPLNGFELHVTTPNFSRDVEVQVLVKRGIETRMHTIGQGKLEALNFKDFKRVQTALYFPEGRRHIYRIVINDEDNPPLNIDGVHGVGPGYQLLFLPRAWQSYELRYGAGNAVLPHYDIAPIQELLRRGFQTTPASLGSVSVFQQKQDGFDLLKILNSDWFLGLVITVMVCVLGWCLYRVGKRVA